MQGARVPAIFMPLRYNIEGRAHIARADGFTHAPLWCVSSANPATKPVSESRAKACSPDVTTR
ncbi:hypothetical protein PSAB6_270176 [Paraburkholderia sabiae]|nr:hypothetical protein PSAB6_270176 [Paraburkholderia sabiae]